MAGRSKGGRGKGNHGNTQADYGQGHASAPTQSKEATGHGFEFGISHGQSAGVYDVPGVPARSGVDVKSGVWNIGAEKPGVV